MRSLLLLALCSAIWPPAAGVDTRICSATTDLSEIHLHDYLFSTYPPYRAKDGATGRGSYSTPTCLKYWGGLRENILVYGKLVYVSMATLFWDQARMDACYNNACGRTGLQTKDWSGCHAGIDIDLDMCRIILSAETDSKNHRNYIFYDGMYGISGPASPYSNETISYDISINLGASQSHAYFPTDGGRNTLWTQLDLIPPSPNPNSFFKLESVLFDAPITFDQTVIHNKGITYSADVAKRVQKRGSQYGIYTNGCAPPILKFTVTFVSSNEKPGFSPKATSICSRAIRHVVL